MQLKNTKLKLQSELQPRKLKLKELPLSLLLRHLKSKKLLNMLLPRKLLLKKLKPRK